MRKFERKARLAAMKRAAKEARRAERAAGAAPADAAAANGDTKTGTVPRPEAGDSPLPPRAAPAPDGGDSPHSVARVAAHKLEVARAAAGLEADAPDLISDAEARAMLASAARMLNSVVAMTSAALAEVPLARLREAFEIVKAKPEPSALPAQQRPRRGFDPVVSLIKTGQAAASLLTRILAKTNPGVVRRRAA